MSEADYGVALLNDCKYGYDIHGNVLRLSLLRSPKEPDPTADQGEQTFTYALLPHRGDFRQGGVVREAYALNVPLRLDALAPAAGAQELSASFLSVDHPAIVAESLKPSADGKSLVVRLYEAHGGRTPARIGFGLPVKGVRRTDLLERETGTEEALEHGAVALTFRPFEIVTLKLALA